MKHMKRILSLLLALVLLMSAAACGKQDDTDSPAEPTGSADATSATAATSAPVVPSVVLDLVKSGKSEFKIIYPEGAGPSLMSEIGDLVTDLRSFTGATLFYSDDFTRASQEELSASYEILIGATNRAESEKWIGAELKNGEYVIVAEGKKLVIGGHTETACVAALRRFVDTYLYDNEELSKGTRDGNLTFTDLDNYTHLRTFSIEEVTVNGKPLSELSILVPDEGYAERYIGKLLRKKLSELTGVWVEVVSESEAADPRAAAIRVGKTKSSTLTAPAGQYAVAVTDAGLEVVSSSVYGYAEVLDALQTKVFRPVDKKVTLTAGQSWSGDANPDADGGERLGDIRLMYHNIWGYLNTDGSNPVSMRGEIAIPVYEDLNPDILCLEEAGNAFRTSARPLFKWLKSAGYAEIVFTSEGGDGNPIFYKKDVLTLIESGYSKKRNGDKGTTWAVFSLKSDPTAVFAVTNSHFAANTNAGGDASLGDVYRKQDAEAVAEAVTAILKKHGQIPVFAGGDFNSTPGTQPCRVLTDLGMKNVTGLTDKRSTVKPYHGTYPYNHDHDLYEFAKPAAAGSYESSIDHIYALLNGASVLQQHVMTDPISTTISDHCPHFVDLKLK